MDFASIGEYGVGIVAIAALVYVFTVFIRMWEKSIKAQNESTKALNRNTVGFMELSKVFEKSHEREVQFQKDVMELMHDTNKKVNEIHNRVVD